MVDYKKTLFSIKTPRYVNIAAGEPFLDQLAGKILTETEANPLALADYEIFLPTRRAMRALTASFIRQSPGQTSFLPKIRAIGALDDDVDLVGEPGAFDSIDLAPAISTLERRLVLAHLTAHHNAAYAGEENWVAALSAATELSKLLDSFYTEEIPFSALEKLEPEEDNLAKHWHVSRDFLTIATTAWPAYLAEKNRMDPIARRIALIRQATTHWQTTPPQHPVIIAGTTGSTPAVAELMKVVANLPKGCVILPGVDLYLDDTAWSHIDDAHPQSGLKALLDALEIERTSVYSWTTHEASSSNNITDGPHPPETSRQTLLALALRPAESTGDWLNRIDNIPEQNLQEGLDGLHIAELQDEEEEATGIALLIRETLEVPDKTALLVTPDRNLTRRVAAILKRWEIDSDDSGGVPFSNTPCGTFLRLVAEWIGDLSNPVCLLAVLRHPLCEMNIEIARLLPHLDKELRGLKPGTGFKNLLTKINTQVSDEKLATISPLLTWIEEATKEFLQSASADTGFTEYFKSHLRAAEFLATNPSQKIADKNTTNLWCNEDGIAGAALMASLLEASHLINSGDNEYSSIFSQLISNETVRRSRPAHPRVLILGPLEARLQTADHIILGGLNEGVWPGEAQIDGFLSRPMRATINLPSPERRIGLAAHDFSQLAASPIVTLTRSKRRGSAPATPSRWMVRLLNILKGIELLPKVDRSSEISSWITALHTPATMTKVNAPAPRPPLEKRPRKLSVTRIEKWLRDPYFIYARYVLKLRKLDRFNETFDARHVGNVIHTVFETHAKQISTLPSDYERDKAILGLNQTLLSEVDGLALSPGIKALWQPAFEESLTWFADWHKARLTEGKPVIIEENGEWSFKTTTHPFTLTAKADRIDIITTEKQQVAAAVYDYKTGSMPSLNQSKTFSPQLSLTSLIVREGGFDAINTKNIERQAFIKTLGRKTTNTDFTGSDVKIVRRPALDETINKAHASLIELIRHFDDPQTPYLSQPRPEFMNDYGDYDQLARRAEWATERDDNVGGTSP